MPLTTLEVRDNGHTRTQRRFSLAAALLGLLLAAVPPQARAAEHSSPRFEPPKARFRGSCATA